MTIEEIFELKRDAVMVRLEQLCEDNSAYSHTVLIEGVRPVWVCSSKHRYDKHGVRQNIGISNEGDTWVDGFSMNVLGMQLCIDNRSTNQEVELAYRLIELNCADLAHMLHTIVDHSNESAMDDALFREFARANATDALNQWMPSKL